MDLAHTLDRPIQGKFSSFFDSCSSMNLVLQNWFYLFAIHRDNHRIALHRDGNNIHWVCLFFIRISFVLMSIYSTYSSPYTRTGTSSSYTPTSPSRTTLSCTSAMRRRGQTIGSGSSSFSASSRSETESNTGSGYQPSDESSDKDNDGSDTGSFTRESENYSRSGAQSGPLSGTRSSETGYDVCPSSDLSELKSRMTYTSTSSWSTPTPSDPDPSSSSSDSGTEGEKFLTASQGDSDYITARTPSSVASFKSLPSIPSEYTTASEGSADYETASEPSTEPTTAYSTAEICPSELESIPSEQGTPKAPSIHLPEEPEEPRTPSAPPSEAPSHVPSIVSSPSVLVPPASTVPPSVTERSVSSPSLVSSLEPSGIALSPRPARRSLWGG